MYYLSESSRPVSGLRLSAIALAVTGALLSSAACADEWFNPAFLSGNGQKVADLSRFENGAGQAPGVYWVDVWLNDELVTTRNVRFDVDEHPPAPAMVGISASRETPDTVSIMTGHVSDDTGLVPCLTLKWLKRLGVKTGDIEALKALPNDDDRCLDFRTLLPGAGSHYDFSTQRPDLTFPQAVLQNSVKDYIPPKEWDEGINAALMNYTLTGDIGRDSNSYYLNLSGGLNLGAWRLRHNGAWNYSDYKNGEHAEQWQNISTYAQRTVIPLKSEGVRRRSARW